VQEAAAPEAVFISHDSISMHATGGIVHDLIITIPTLAKLAGKQWQAAVVKLKQSNHPT